MQRKRSKLFKNFKSWSTGLVTQSFDSVQKVHSFSGMYSILFAAIVTVLLPVFSVAETTAATETTTNQLPSCNQQEHGPLHFVKVEIPGNHCAPDDLFCSANKGDNVWFICDADNYNSSMWLKNSTYPVVADNNYYWLYQEGPCENQLLIRHANFQIIGNYSCILSNGTHNISRDFHLYNVCEEVNYDKNPEPHQVEGDACLDRSVELGADTVLYCEFCARTKWKETTLHWLKLVSDPSGGLNSSWVPVERLNIIGTTFTQNRTELINCDGPKQETPYDDPRCLSTDPDSVGSYLHIQGVTQEALGQYRLEARVEAAQYVSTTPEIKLSEKIIHTIDKTAAVLGAMAAVLVIALTSAFLWYKFNLDLKLMFRDRFSKVEARGNRDYDAYIVYNSSSEEILKFVTEFIRPKLTENKYQVFIRDIDMLPGGFRAEDIVEAINSSLRCVIIVSESFLSEQGQHLQLQINAAIHDMADKNTKIIPILFGDVNITALGRLLVVLRCLRFKNGKTNKTKFLKRLLLRMPVKSRDEVDQVSLMENMEMCIEGSTDA